MGRECELGRAIVSSPKISSNKKEMDLVFTIVGWISVGLDGPRNTKVAQGDPLREGVAGVEN
jgi:hypothetical protein